MFTWICPVCGAEVPPSASECPRCAERRQQTAAPPPPGPPNAPPYGPPPPAAQQAPPYGGPPQASSYAPPQAQAYPPAPPPQGYAYAPQAAQPVYTIGNNHARRGVPAWLAAVLTMAVLGGGLFLVYRWVAGGKSGAPAQAQKSPFVPAGEAASAHPYAKFVEVTGIRLLEGPDKKPLVRFLVVNHAPIELRGLGLKISLETANAAPGEAVIAVIDAHPDPIPPQGAKDMESPLATHLKFYELPDWQYVRAKVEITSK